MHGQRCAVRARARECLSLLQNLTLGPHIGRRELHKGTWKSLQNHYRIVMILCTVGVTAGATRWALAAIWAVRRVWDACATLCAHAAAHRVLAPHTKRVRPSPTYVCLSPCRGSHPRHRKRSLQLWHLVRAREGATRRRSSGHASPSQTIINSFLAAHSVATAVLRTSPENIIRNYVFCAYP